VKLFHKIILSVILPLTVFSAVSLVYKQSFISQLDESITAGHANDAKKVHERMVDTYKHLRYIAKIIGSSREIVYAVENADNDYLASRSDIFLDGIIDNIIVTDLDGIVISRAPEEFRFGDSLSESFYFSSYAENGSYYGIADMDGHDSLILVYPIKKYMEFPVGAVIVSAKVDAALLLHFVENTSGILEYISAGGAVSSDPASVEKIVHTVHIPDMSMKNQRSVQFVLKATQSSSYIQLIQLRKFTTFGYVLAFLLISSFIYLIIRHHLKPFEKLTGRLERFDGTDSSLIELRQELERLNSAKQHEVQGIVSGLTRMMALTESKIDMLKKKNDELNNLNRTDPLTRLSNRMHVELTLDLEYERRKRYESPMSLILLDIDNFKEINSAHGHSRGDQVLSEFADILRSNTRTTDTIGRWGGEEFIVVCPETNEQQAFQLAEKVHQILNTSNITGLSVTASIGISELKGADNIHELLKRADKAISRAKSEGRNTIRIA
jgi:diguanylate cyclase (GGDEF)-like protein